MAEVAHETRHKSSYTFQQGHPPEEAARKAYDDADLSRAIQAYKFFYPTVSGAAIVKGNDQVGLVPNKVFGIVPKSLPSTVRGSRVISRQ